MKKPRPLPKHDARYPKLTSRPRQIFRKLAIGAAALTLGPLIACEDTNDNKEDQVQLDGGEVSYPDDDMAMGGADGTNAELTAPETDVYPDDDMVLGGVALPPTLRAPETGYTSLYLENGGYLSYAIQFEVDYGEDERLGEELQAIIDEANLHLLSYDCDAFSTELTAIQQEVSDALKAKFETEGLWNLSLLIEMCDPYGGLDGDMPEPDYP